MHFTLIIAVGSHPPTFRCHHKYKLFPSRFVRFTLVRMNPPRSFHHHHHHHLRLLCLFTFPLNFFPFLNGLIYASEMFLGLVPTRQTHRPDWNTHFTLISICPSSTTRRSVYHSTGFRNARFTIHSRLLPLSFNLNYVYCRKIGRRRISWPWAMQDPTDFTHNTITLISLKPRSLNAEYNDCLTTDLRLTLFFSTVPEEVFFLKSF